MAVTNSSGTLTSQQRYLPFGAPRTIPNSPILGTDFTYTGQRKLDDDMGGIMDYKARFYSPALGRFLQPDTIIPNQFNPQSWNRFSYVGNNPIRYNDPSGNISCDYAHVAAGDCEDRDFWTVLEQDYNIFFTGNFPRAYRSAILRGTRDVGLRLSQERGKNESVFGAFQATYGLDSRPLYYLYGNTSSEFINDGSGFNEDGTPRGCQITGGACTVGKTLRSDGTPVFLIKFVTMSSNPLSARNTAVHELGHLFGSQVAGYTEMSLAINQNPGIYGRPDTSQNYGFASAGFPWQQATHNVNWYYEVFADQFLGWIYDTWEVNVAGALTDAANGRRGWMNSNMHVWLANR